MFAASRAVFSRTMRRGDRGDDVRRLQELLQAAGYDPGPIDGIFGSRTHDAVVAFQRSQGLAADGLAGPLTMGALAGVGTPVTGSATGLSLHIGLNRVNPAAYPFTVPELAGCVNDATDMQAIAAGQGFRPRQLINEAATSTAVLDSIRAAADQLNAGDIFLITYSGHGSQVPDPAEVNDQRSETWVLYDRQVIDDELYAAWGGFRSGVRVLVVSDSCHSGTVTRELRRLNAELSRETEQARPLLERDRGRMLATRGVGGGGGSDRGTGDRYGGAETSSRSALARDLVAVAHGRDGAGPAVALAADAAPGLALRLADALTPVLAGAGVSRAGAARELAGDAVGRLVRGVTSTRALSGFDQPVLDVLDVPRLLDEGLAAADLLERPDVYRSVAERSRSAAAPVADVLLLAACQDNQTASDGRPDPTGHQNGAFTRALRGVWQSALDYADLHSKIVAQLPSTQSPNLYWATDPDLGFQRQPPFRI